MTTNSEVSIDHILHARQTLRVPMTELIAMYYKLKLDLTDTQLIHSDIPVLSQQYLLPEQPLNIYDIDRFLIWDTQPAELVSSSSTNMISILKRQSKYSKLYNGFCYQLLNTDGRVFRFCPGDYFSFLNTCEYLSYELTKAIVSHKFAYDLIRNGDRQALQQVASLLLEQPQMIPARANANPFEFHARATAFGTCTLVIIKHSERPAQFILNFRSLELSETPGLLHVIPAGTFQPKAQNDRFHETEFSFFENIIREFAEELLDDNYVRGDAPSVFDASDMYGDKGKLFRKTVIEPNNFEMLYLGMVIDPINLKPEILTVLILHDSLALETSWETQTGSKLRFYDFTEEQLLDLINESLFVPTGKAHLWLVLKHYKYIASKLASI